MIKNRTAILALLTGLNLLNYIDRYVVAAVLKRIQEPIETGGLGLSNLQGGLLATAFLAGYFVTSPIFGCRPNSLQITTAIPASSPIVTRPPAPIQLLSKANLRK